MSKPWNKLIVALDVTSEKKIKHILKVLSPKVKKFKVGLIAYTRFGPETIKWIHQRGGKVFLDFKLFDIPNTMAETAKSFIDLGVWAFTIHLRSGEKSIKLFRKELLKAARLKKVRAPLIIGVTELTSQKASVTGVLNLAKVAKQCSLDGVVCSVWEAGKIKQKFGLRTITPGIRKGKDRSDQKRVATVGDAVKNKVDYFVVGRPIVCARDYLKAAEDIMLP